MGERFNRKSWDKYGGTTTTYNNEETRRGGTDQELATKRISDALSEGKEFVLPGEIVNKRGVSLRIADLRGDFATIVRHVIDQQSDERTRNQLREYIGFIQGKVEKATTLKEDEQGTVTEITEKPTDLYAFGLSEKFYLTRLPYIEALGIFMKTIETNYLRELLGRYPSNSKKRAKLAGMDKQRLEALMREYDLGRSPLPFDYNLKPLPDSSLSTIDTLCEEDEIMFSSTYMQSLRTRTSDNFNEMLRLSGLSQEELKKMLERFPQQ